MPSETQKCVSVRNEYVKQCKRSEFLSKLNGTDFCTSNLGNISDVTDSKTYECVLKERNSGAKSDWKQKTVIVSKKNE
jgi:hypothetical protein